jgi:16S rRNA (guanine527-N7)-methyltransferase
VLAHDWVAVQATFVEVQSRRAQALRRFATRLDLQHRIEIVEERAEVVAHDQVHRERYDLVTARSFGPPAVTAETAAGLVRMGGWLVVSEPPGGALDRWARDPMHELGFGAPALATANGASYMATQKQRPTLSETPRNATKLAKQPLW